MSKLKEVAALEAELAAMRKELDEADRRAGAAERKAEYLKASLAIQKGWLLTAKREAGYPSNMSFDVVWERTLEAARKYKSMIDSTEREVSNGKWR